MRAEECTAGYMSPLVRQDLARLDKDGDSRRVALFALKQYVENLDPGSVPRFLAQVSESKDTGGSRSYAISLYEEVARVHGKLIIPQFGKVMTTLTRSLSASGSSPQLHQACAKVAAALIRYTIDPDTSEAEAEEILKEVSRPLVDLLAGKLEHVAAGSATCMQALVESEKWKHAPADLVSEVCHRTTTALGDKSTRTVAHMQLARSLATMNPGTLNVYGACLLHAAEEVLSVSTYSWQQRKCAAKMAQAVLAIVDRETLALEFHSITQVLENCKHDRIPHVRTAVWEALQTAKMLMNGEAVKEEDHGDYRGSKSFDSTKETPQRRNWSSNNYSPSSQDTYNLSSYTPPPDACDSAASAPSLTSHTDSTGRMKRPLMFPTKFDDHAPRSPAPPFAVGVNNNHVTFSGKENVPSSVLDGATPVSRKCMSAYHVPAPPFYDKLVGDKASGGNQRIEKAPLDDNEFTPATIKRDHPKGKIESRFSPFETLITRSFGEAEGDLMAEGEEILYRNSAELDGELCGKSEARSRCNSRLPTSMGLFRPDPETPEFIADSVQSNIVSHKGMQSGYSDANSSAALDIKGCGRNTMTGKVVDLLEHKQISHTGFSQGLTTGHPNAYDLNEGVSHAQYMKLDDFSSNPEDGYSALKPRVLITTADFLPYTTPRRLVLSLQSQLSSPGDEVGQEDVRGIDDGMDKTTDVNSEGVRRIADGTGKRIDFNDDADMDVESSSDSGWSVRDNPIASDESATEESSEEEVEERHTEIHETFALPRKVHNITAASPGKNADSSLSSDSEHSKFPELVEQSRVQVEDDDLRHQITRSLGTSAGSVNTNMACASLTESQRKWSAQKAQEWDLDLDVSRTTDDQPNEAKRSMSLEQEVVISTNISQGSEACVGENEVWEDEDVSGRWWSNTALVRCARSGCARISSIAELVLRGSLCVVIAVPISMVLARSLQSPPDYFLVPT
ncbi:uncharacterized protein [Physcomitrium patens]|uniref:TORTIFOLIA1/SINE1-2 N-terminal domain-containing protein n=1 Tax=Physcomitrium patens TaxID=3218 RepID=A9T920_PHYPA|nr:uncharacterized protein LOC112282963 [Physcomitrium patens]XP_024376982.1 uncharacterized protein LOC112282963 [Physcomitrium patens]PNR53689.1 hypothetical protein PHYPA_007364 [Physcomitrium patens]|eukprot:XP_024376981.1 uncharacterized protein LOC112282963 [Physcomitrella patens]